MKSQTCWKSDMTKTSKQRIKSMPTTVKIILKIVFVNEYWWQAFIPNTKRIPDHAKPIVSSDVVQMDSSRVRK